MRTLLGKEQLMIVAGVTQCHTELHADLVLAAIIQSLSQSQALLAANSHNIIQLGVKTACDGP